jgi:hypothetical protein
MFILVGKRMLGSHAVQGVATRLRQETAPGNDIQRNIFSKVRIVGPRVDTVLRDEILVLTFY